MPVPEQPRLLPAVQYLRFVAALLVVSIHAFQAIEHAGRGDLPSSFPGGASGVDVFFAISGFIMVYISNNPDLTARRFMLDRITRISPPYWLLTTMLFVLTFVAPHLFFSLRGDLAVYLSSMLYIPWPNPAQPGNPPLLPIGWTLDYEMFFYALFAIATATSRRYRVELTSAAIVLLLCLRWAPLPANVWTEFLVFPIMLEFVFGMLIARFAIGWRLPTPVLLAILAVGTGWLVSNFHYDLGHTSHERMWLWGIPAALIVLAVVKLDLARKVPVNPFLVLLGNASYALYLTHMFTLGAMRMLWGKLGAHKPHDIVMLLVLLAVSVAASVVFYTLIEKPLTRVVRRVVLGEAKPRPVAVPA